MKRRRKDQAEIDVRQALTAVPCVTDAAEARSDSRDLIQIRMELSPVSGVRRFLARRLGWKQVVRINLDEYGSFFWRQIDGVRPLGEIARRMAGQYSLARAEADKAAIAFTRTLMLRHVVYLKVPQDWGRSGAPAQTEPADGSVHV